MPDLITQVNDGGKSGDNGGKLLREAAGGSVPAFEQIIVNYEKLIYNIAYRLLGNPEDAMDAAQEAVIKIYCNIHKCNDINTLKAWICKITNNTCIDELRRRKGKREESLQKLTESEDGAYSIQFEVSEISPEDAVLLKERNIVLQAAINKLPPKYKTLIVLRDINGLSYEELAEAAGLSMGTVKSRLSRARERLKRLLAGLQL